jgi:hypothetical protein
MPSSCSYSGDWNLVNDHHMPWVFIMEAQKALKHGYVQSMTPLLCLSCHFALAVAASHTRPDSLSIAEYRRLQVSMG